MSVAYRIAGRGARLTLPRIRRIAKELGGRIDPANPPRASERVLVLPTGFLHLYRTGRTAWNEFIRYGGNWQAEDEWVSELQLAGFEVLSEHDEGY